MDKPILELENISAGYRGLQVLNQVSLSLPAGQIAALMGPNGAGKSTILKTVFGLVKPSHGTIRFHDQTISPVPYQIVQQGVSLVPQGRRVFHNLTVEENLEIGGINLSRTALKERIKELMAAFPVLHQKRRSRSSALSGGQQQILAIARGLVMDPKVLLLDEPSLGLAPKMVKEIFGTIKNINEQFKTTILIVEHNLKSLLEIADQAYVLDRGSIIAHGEPQKLLASGVLEKVLIGRGEDGKV